MKSSRMSKKSLNIGVLDESVVERASTVTAENNLSLEVKSIAPLTFPFVLGSSSGVLDINQNVLTEIVGGGGGLEYSVPQVNATRYQSLLVDLMPPPMEGLLTESESSDENRNDEDDEIDEIDENDSPDELGTNPLAFPLPSDLVLALPVLYPGNTLTEPNESSLIFNITTSDNRISQVPAEQLHSLESRLVQSDPQLRHSGSEMEDDFSEDDSSSSSESTSEDEEDSDSKNGNKIQKRIILKKIRTIPGSSSETSDTSIRKKYGRKSLITKCRREMFSREDYQLPMSPKLQKLAREISQVENFPLVGYNRDFGSMDSMEKFNQSCCVCTTFKTTGFWFFGIVRRGFRSLFSLVHCHRRHTRRVSNVSTMTFNHTSHSYKEKRLPSVSQISSIEKLDILNNNLLT